MGIKHYDKSLKERAIKLSYELSSVLQAAKELGVSDSPLSKWSRDFAQYGANSFPGRGVERLTDEQREIKRLQTELRDKELDVDTDTLGKD